MEVPRLARSTAECIRTTKRIDLRYDRPDVASGQRITACVGAGPRTYARDAPTHLHAEPQQPQEISDYEHNGCGGRIRSGRSGWRSDYRGHDHRSFHRYRDDVWLQPRPGTRG